MINYIIISQFKPPRKLLNRGARKELSMKTTLNI